MAIDFRKLSEPLRADQIDFRVQSINKGGYATILAYKDARCDMQRLDDICGPLNWEREHLHQNHNCIVSIYNANTGEWVSKEDTGTASNTEAAKGLASDSFKRACFNWGIGRELYDYPDIRVKLNDKEYTIEGNKGKQTWNLKLREWQWKTLFNGSQVIAIEAIDEKGSKRFSWRSDGQEQFMATLANIKQMQRSKDSEGLVQELDEMAQDEELYDSVWRALKPAERKVITDLTNEERKAQKEESK